MIVTEMFGNGVKTILNLYLDLKHILYIEIIQEVVLIKNIIYYLEELGQLQV